MAHEYTTNIKLTMTDQATGEWNKFQNQMERGVGRIKQQFDRIRTAATGLFSAYAIKNFVELSNKQEIASANLANALRLAGNYSEAAQKQMEAYSNQLQDVTMYSNDVITNTQALLVQTTGLTGKAVEPLTMATLNMASAFHLQADQVAILVGKTYQGQQALSRYGISTKGAKTQAEKLNMMLSQMNKLFSGQALAAGATAAGRLAQFKNAVEDLEKKLGNLIKDALVPLLGPLQEFVKELTALPVPLQAAIFWTAGLTVAMYALTGTGPLAAIKGLAAGITTVLIPAIKAAGVQASAAAGIWGLLAAGAFYAATKFYGAWKIKSEATKNMMKADAASIMSTYADEIKRLGTLPPVKAKFEWKWEMGDLDKQISKVREQIHKLGWNTQSEEVTKLKNKYNALTHAFELLTGAQKANIATTGETEIIDKLNKSTSDLQKKVKEITWHYDAYTAALAKNQLEQAKLDKITKQAARDAELLLHPWEPLSRALAFAGLQYSNLDISAEKAAASLREVAAIPLPSWMNQSQAALIERFGATIQNTFAGLSQTMTSVFSGNTTNAVKAFVKTIGNLVIDLVEAEMLGATASEYFKAISTFGISIVTDAPLLAAGMVALEGLRGVVSSFHQGGSFYVNAPPSVEVPILVRGGERGIIQTEKQQQAAQYGPAGGHHITVNINAAGTPKEMVVEAIQEALRESGKPIEQTFVNNRSNMRVPG